MKISRLKESLSLFVVLFWGVVFAGSASATDVPGGTITTSTTWNTAGSPYIIMGSLTIQNGAILTINPGVEVRFNNNYSIQVGGSTPGSLIAQGNAGSHITFTTTASYSGNWDKIYFTSNASLSSQLSYCDFNKGGSSQGVVYCQTSSPILSNLSFSNSATYGIYLTSTAAPAISGSIIQTGGSNYLIYNSGTDNQPTFTTLTVSSSGKLAVGGLTFWKNFFSSSPVINGGPYEADIYGDTLKQSMSFGGIAGISAIHLQGTLNISDPSNPTLTIQLGTIVKLDSSAGITVGGFSSNQLGALVAVGTAGQKIQFLKYGASKWSGIQFNDFSNDAVSKLQYCELVDGGSNGTASIYCSNASPLLSNLSITNSASAGLYFSTSASSVSNVTVSNSSQHGIYLSSFTGSLSNLSISGFGMSYAGINFSSSSPTLSGTNSVIGPGNNGIYLSNSFPSLSGLSISGVTNEAIYTTDTSNAPTFSNISVSSVGKLAQGSADFWANLIASNPTISGGPYEQTVISSTLTKNTSWGGQSWLSNLYLKGLTIQGSTTPVLTLSPGTIVKLDQSVEINVGGSSSNQFGALVAVGTAVQKIQFIKYGLNKWGGIRFNDLSNDAASTLQYCDLIDGGSNGTASIYCSNASPLLSNLTITNSASSGIYCSTSASSVSNVSVSNSAQHGLYLSSFTGSLSNLSVSGFGTSYAGLNFSSSSPSLTGTNTILGPGLYGVQFSSSSPSLSGLSISGVTGEAIYTSETFSVPTFSNINISGVGKLAQGNADFWANFISSNPTISGGPYEQTVVNSTLTKNTNWGGQSWLSNIYLKGLGIQGPTTPVLTLAPGTIVKLDSNVEITIGGSSSNQFGAIVAVGTAGQKIQFIKYGANKWGGIRFNDLSSDTISKLQYCDIVDSGTNNSGAVYCTSASPILSNLIITNSSSSGIYLTSNSLPSLSNLSISGFGTTGYAGISFNNSPANLTGTNSITGPGSYGVILSSSPPTLSGLNISGVTNEAIYANDSSIAPTFSNISISSVGKLALGSADFWANFISSNPTISGGPYEQTVINSILTKNTNWGGQSWLTNIYLKGLAIQGSATPVLTLAPGTIVKLDQSVEINVGGSSSNQFGALVAVGTAAQKIQFIKYGVNKWGGIRFNDLSSDAISKLQYCELVDGGSNGTASIYCSNASPLLSNLTITNSASAGLYFSTSASSVSNVTVDNSSQYGIYISSFTGSLSNLSVSGFGSSYAGLNFSNSSPSLTGTNTITGPGFYGVQFSSSSPSLSGLSISGVTNEAIFTADTVNAPTFSNISISSVGKLAQGGADFWANFISSNPTISGGPYEQNVIVSTLTKNTSWGGQSWLSNLHLTGTLTIQNPTAPTLTLQPGTVVKLDQNVGITVGGSSSNQLGALVAVGTAGQKIQFLKYGANKWSVIQFNDFSNDAVSKLQYCELIDGGTGGTGIIYCTNASPTLSNLTISNSNYHGLYLNSFAGSLSNLNITGFGSSYAGIYFSNSSPSLTGTNTILGPGLYGVQFSSASPSLSGLSISGVSGEAIYTNETFSVPTFSNINISNVGKLAQGNADLWANFISSNPSISGGPYEQTVINSTLTKNTIWGGQSWLSNLHLTGTLTIQNPTTPTLTLQPGTVVKLDQSVGITVGGSSSNQFGALVAVGTAGQKIQFLKYSANKWSGIQFNDLSNDATSKLQHCDLVDGGANGTGAVYCTNASPALSNLTITNSSNQAIYLSGTASPTFSGSLTQTGGTNYLIYSSGVDVQPTFNSVIASSSGKLAIGGLVFWKNFFSSSSSILGGPFEADVYGDTLKQSMSLGGVTGISAIHLLGSLNISNPSAPVLTVQPGTILKLDSSVGITVGGSSSNQLGALVAVGTAAQKIQFVKAGANKWYGIQFNDFSNDAVSKLQYCDVVDGGANGSGAVYCTNASPTLSNLTIASSASSGLYLLSNSAPNLSNLTISGFGTNSSGLYCSGSSPALIGTNTINGPGLYGVFVASSSPSINGVTISGVSGETIFGNDDLSKPAFSALTLSGAKLAQGGPDFWANFLNSNPTVSGGPYEQTVLGGVLTKSTTWGGKSWISHLRFLSGVNVLGNGTNAILTLLPGVTVKFNNAASLSANGGGYGYGSIVANGNSSPAGKIIFTSDSGATWYGVTLNANLSNQPSPNSSFSYCVFDKGNLVKADGFSSLDVQYCEFKNISNGYPLAINQGTAALVGLNIHDCVSGLAVGTTQGEVSVKDSTFTSITNDGINASNKLASVDSCVFQNVGRGIAIASNAGCLVQNSQFLNWSTTAIDAPSGSYVAIDHCIFKGAASVLKMPAGFMDLFADPSMGNSIEPTGSSNITIYSDDLNEEATWRPVSNIPYNLTSSVSYKKKLTILAGTTLKMSQSASLNPIGSTASLQVKGTAASPVLFTSALPNPAPGNWFGMNINQNSLLEYATFEYQNSGLTLASNSTLKHCTIRKSSGAGITQTVSAAMTTPTVLEDCTVANNGGNGVECNANTRVNVLRSTIQNNTLYGLKALANSPSVAAIVDIRESNVTGNTLGGIFTQTNAKVDAAYCYWGAEAGPSGNAITGTGTTKFNPWFATAVASPFWLSNPSVTPLTFVPVSGSSSFHAVATIPSNWKIEVKNAAQALVVDWSGTGENIDLEWKGVHLSGEETPPGGHVIPPIAPTTPPVKHSRPGTGSGPVQPPHPTPLPDGIYTFKIKATTALYQSILVGSITLDSTIVIAKIDLPTALSFIGSGKNLTVSGDATGTQFASYILEYGVGSEPDTFTTIQNSPSSVKNGTLGSVTLPNLESAYLTVRLRVKSSTNQESVDSVLLQLVSLVSSAISPSTFSPNGDGYQDDTNISSGISWPSSWTAEIFKQADQVLWSHSGSGDQIFFTWNGKDNSGQLLADGTYSLKLKATSQDDHSVSTERILTVVLSQAGKAIQILSPIDGAIITGTTPITLGSNLPAGTEYFVRLEYGQNDDWTELGAGNTLPNPFANWDTRTVMNGQYQLRATLILWDGSAHEDLKNVNVRNLNMTVANRIFDPVTGEGAWVTVTDDSGSTTNSNLHIEAYPAATSYDSLFWEGIYSGYGSPTPVWQTDVVLPAGQSSASVFWNGKDNLGALLPTGEYTWRAVLTYSNGSIAKWEEPLATLSKVMNDTMSQKSVGAQQGANFDPYFGESVDVKFKLSQPMWITLASNVGPTFGIAPKLFYNSGDQVYWWDGRHFNEQGLGYPNGGTNPIYIKATLPPKTLTVLKNTSLTLDSVTVNPITIFPTYGQSTTVSYSLSRQALVTIKIYDTVAGPVGTVYSTGQTSTLQTQGAHQFVWDGTDESHNYPYLDGNYTIEITAQDPQYPSYKTVLLKSVRVHP